jgi:hypothetical protein
VKTYGLNSPSLDVYYEKCVSNACAKIDVVFRDSLDAVRTQLNLQYRIGAPCFGLFGTTIYPLTSTTQLLFSSFHKNLIAFLAATDLTRNGLYGQEWATHDHDRASRHH